MTLVVGLFALYLGNYFNSLDTLTSTKKEQQTGKNDVQMASNIAMLQPIIIKPESSQVNIDSILWIAKRYIGTPYKMGGLGFNGMDCSGLVKTVFEEVGIALPHNSNELAKHGILISKKDDLKKGDILFFHTEWENENMINHVGIYIGNGYFIHATTSLGTIISKLKDPAYKNNFICATRILLPQPVTVYAGNTELSVIK